MKKINEEGMKSYLGLPSEAKNIISVLRIAKSQTGDPDLDRRYQDAILAIGDAWLDWVEKHYEPEKKLFRVHVMGERWLEVMAKDADDAEQIVNNGGIADHETTEDVEEVVR